MISPESLPPEVIAAANEVEAQYNRARRARSQEVFGHPGAHIATIPPPTTADLVAAALNELGCRWDDDDGHNGMRRLISAWQDKP